jgi:hypothetical protein
MYLFAKAPRVTPQLIQPLFNGYWRIFSQEQIIQGEKLTTHSHLVPNLKMSGAIFSLLHMPTQHAQGPLIFTFSTQLEIKVALI